jgi:hypothetical protein
MSGSVIGIADGDMKMTMMGETRNAYMGSILENVQLED